MKRVRYISSFAKPMTQTDIQTIAEQAQRHNKEHGITGMLVASGTLFFQIIEGPEEAIDSLYSNIERDPRHTNVLLLSSESGEIDRICPDWSMHKIDLSLMEQEKVAPIQVLLQMVFTQSQLVENAINALERYAWGEFLSIDKNE